MIKFGLLTLILCVAEIVLAIVYGIKGEWEHMLPSLGYAFLYGALFCVIGRCLASQEIIDKLTEYCVEQEMKIHQMRKDGKKTIEWYQKENKRLHDQLQRLKEIYHLNIENDDETLNVD